MWKILLLLSLCACIATAASVPIVNQYRLNPREYQLAPTTRQFTISSKDQCIPTNPHNLYYTQLNTLKPKAVYTIPPYPQTNALPPIGDWMLHISINAMPYYELKLPKGVHKNQIQYPPAHWINLTSASGKYIIEPINYLFVVFEKNKQHAEKAVSNALNSSGFSSKDSKTHGGGYYAYINNKRYSQLANQAGTLLAFSNNASRLAQNDHIRVMGPSSIKINHKKAFLFVGSISEESGALPSMPVGKQITKNPIKYNHLNLSHHFVSFSHARSDLAYALIQHGYPTYYVMSNNVLHTVGESTEDHDGKVFVTIISKH